MYDTLSAHKACAVKKTPPLIPLWSPVTFAPRGFGQIRPRATRRLLIRLLDGRRTRIAESFQSVCIQDHLSGCIRVSHGWVYSLAGVSETPVLNPTFAIEMAKHNAAIEQREADPQAVQGEEGQDCPPPHAFEGIVEWAEQQAPQAMPIAEDDLFLPVKIPSRANYHCDLLSPIAVATMQ